MLASTAVLYIQATPYPMFFFARINLILGISAFLFSWVMLRCDIEPFPTWFYCFAWWSYIITVDSMVYFRKGTSLILTRTREFLFLLPSSVLIWLVFESFNLILKNWYYINVIETTALRWIGYSVSFATVLPGIFETFEFLETTSLLQKWQIKPIQFTNAGHTYIMLTGAVLLSFALLYPRYCFPLVWCGFILFLDPINYRWGVPTFLAYGEKGALRKPVLLMIAGLLCGVFWEFWNYWATTKWIYTVPFFDENKLFEMTTPGFLGFIPFALECYVMVSFIYLFRKISGWEQTTAGLVKQNRFHPFTAELVIICSVIFCISVFQGMDRITVGSYRPFIRDLESIDKGKRIMLEQCGMVQVKDLLKLKASATATQAIMRCAAVSRDELARWIQDAEMVMLKGMGTYNFNLLSNAGIRDIRALVLQEPHALRIALEQHAKQTGMNGHIPEEAKLKVWIKAAQTAASR